MIKCLSQVLQDNHGNSSSGEPYYNPQYGFSEAATGALL